MHDYDTAAAVGRRRQYKFICICVRIKPLQYKALENINRTVWVPLYICGRGNPRYFHSDVYVSFLFGSRSFNRKPLLNYKFAANSNAKSHRNVIRFLLRDVPSIRYPYYHRRKMNVRTREIILKETATTIFFFLFLSFFLFFFFFLKNNFRRCLVLFFGNKLCLYNWYLNYNNIFYYNNKRT